ncbi:MAG: hypothetical protein KC415_06300 [Anaerolineales bacterium]|nr:hypothetical protein [Anaerolineales bacterium]MCB8991454.1 hypothetical protein [Ardenticatenaceae bacterium]MCB9003926.1 hypothetical protein [Ardenticatenaceae bacterium]
MNRKILLVGIVLLLLLAACGGNSNSAEPAAVESPAENSSTNSDTSANTESTVNTTNDTAVADAEPTDEAPAAEETADDGATEEPAPAEEPAVEEPAADDIYGGLPTSGTDPDTGLEINPPELLQGIEFIVRGKIVSMNLTPQTDPEFLIESPDGVRYRVHSQGIADIYFLDGTQLAAHQYRQGMIAQATVFQDTNAGVTTVVDSEDLMLISMGE